MTGRPLSEKEFADTKSRKVRGYAQQFETLGRINEQVADLWANGLPMSELQREYDGTVKATLAETNAAAAKYARPEKATIVLVGDYARIGTGPEGADARRGRAGRHGREAGPEVEDGAPPPHPALAPGERVFVCRRSPPDDALRRRGRRGRRRGGGCFRPARLEHRDRGVDDDREDQPAQELQRELT